LQQTSTACYDLICEVQRPGDETGKKIGNGHVDIVVVGACSQTWGFAHRDYHENVSSERCYADYGHDCCKEDRNTEPTRRLISKTIESGVVHRNGSSCQAFSKSNQVK